MISFRNPGRGSCEACLDCLTGVGNRWWRWTTIGLSTRTSSELVKWRTIALELPSSDWWGQSLWREDLLVPSLAMKLSFLRVVWDSKWLTLHGRCCGWTRGCLLCEGETTFLGAFNPSFGSFFLAQTAMKTVNDQAAKTASLCRYRALRGWGELSLVFFPKRGVGAESAGADYSVIYVRFVHLRYENLFVLVLLLINS